jgi:HAD superfamily hydrolase (TIGR01509 family)
MARFDDVRLVIFDCDGVVADSELLATRVLQEGLAEQGVTLSHDEVVERFLGRSAETIANSLKSEFGLVLDTHAHETMQLRLFDLFRAELQAIDGIEALLAQLTVPYCMASSSQMARIDIALEATGLAHYFTGRIFNAAMVARGKPAPDLFLHAAETMGVPPAQSLVIEDSPAGIEAAKRAGMRVIGFTGGGHAQGVGHRVAVAAAHPDLIMASMADIAAILSSGRQAINRGDGLDVGLGSGRTDLFGTDGKAL